MEGYTVQSQTWHPIGNADPCAEDPGGCRRWRLSFLLGVAAAGSECCHTFGKHPGCKTEAEQRQRRMDVRMLNVGEIVNTA